MKIVLVVAVGFAAAALPSGAQEPAEDETVPLYTNEDLAKFGPPSEDEDAPDRGDADWKFVLDFLDRQYERLDAQRSVELERARIEMRARELERQRESMYRGYIPHFLRFYPWRKHGPAKPWRALPVRRDRPAPNGARAVTSRLHAPIVPLHARR